MAGRIHALTGGVRGLAPSKSWPRALYYPAQVAYIATLIVLASLLGGAVLGLIGLSLALLFLIPATALAWVIGDEAARWVVVGLIVLGGAWLLLVQTVRQLRYL